MVSRDLVDGKPRKDNPVLRAKKRVSTSFSEDEVMLMDKLLRLVRRGDPAAAKEAGIPELAYRFQTLRRKIQEAKDG